MLFRSREVGFKLPEMSWWEIFDTDREELGFLVASMTSMEAFTSHEEQAWADKIPPMTIEKVAKYG